MREGNFWSFSNGFAGSPICNGDRPIIGLSSNIINGSSAVAFQYTKAVYDAGAIPMLISATCEMDLLRGCVDKIDGLLLTGGADISACYFGEKDLDGLTDVDPFRDEYEFKLLRLAVDRGLPIFGICRGMQLINVAFGGSIYQDLPSQFPSDVLNHSVLTDKHVGVHDVKIEPDTRLSDILECGSISVNSRHHQALKDVAEEFKVTAVSEDIVVEAFEAYPSRRIIGVQWHPENMAVDGENIYMKRLFKFFVNEASLFREACEIHDNNLIIDSHCDTPMLFDEHKIDFSIRSDIAKVDIQKMIEGRVDVSVVVAYIPQKVYEYEGGDFAFAMAKRLIGELKAKIGACDKFACVAESVDDLLVNKERRVKSFMIGLENGCALNGDLDNIQLFKDMGLVYITLCHNGPNDICDSCVGEPVHDGLSDFGRVVVSQMNNLGVVVDMSHASEKSVLDVLGCSSHPIIASHSSSYALCAHKRNLSDEVIIKIAEKGGVVHVCLYDYFLKEGGGATILDIVDHLEHIISLTGYEHVGVGSDFDGGGGIVGCNGSNELINITVELLRRGHKSSNISKIWGANFMRVIRQVQL